MYIYIQTDFYIRGHLHCILWERCTLGDVQCADAINEVIIHILLLLFWIWRGGCKCQAFPYISANFLSLSEDIRT